MANRAERRAPGRKSKRKTRAKREPGRGWLRFGLPVLAALLVLIVGAWWVRQRATGSTALAVEMAPMSQLPETVQRAPWTVREAYRFAVANPQVLDTLPCYCGCGGLGHESNLDCFVERFEEDGSVAYGYHAFE